MAEQLELPFVEFTNKNQKECNLCDTQETVITNKQSNEQMIYVSCKRCGSEISVQKKFKTNLLT